MSDVVFSIPDYAALGAKIARSLAAPEGEIQTSRFADGERYLRILTKVRDLNVVLVGGTIHDTATLDLFDLASGLVSEGCRSLKIVLPFFGYSTMERAVKSGEVVTAKTRARLLSAIPTAPFGNEIVLLDLHSEGLPFYFEGTIKAHHLYGKPLVMREARRMGGTNFTLGAPDAGRAKWVESLANDLDVPAGFVYKRRAETGEVAITGVNIPVSDCDVIIYDDMIRSGGSILQAARAYCDGGAKSVSLITTHGIFTEGAVAKLKASGVVREIVCTDSHPNALSVNDPFVTVVSVAELFAEYLKGAKEVT